MGSVHFTDGQCSGKQNRPTFSLKNIAFTGITGSATHIRYTPGSSAWKKRTVLEKVLLVISATLLFVIFVLAFLLGAADDRIRDARVSA